MRRPLSLALAIVLLLLACRWSQSSGSRISTPQNGVGTVLVSFDIPYAEVPGVDPDLLSLDIYRVSGEAGRPVMIYVHGGAWAIGDKSQVDLKDDVFVQSGYVFVSVNYRLSPKVAFPTHAEDVASAVRWIYDHIGGYGGDPERLFLMGHSAGAHLVALVATDERYLQTVGLDLADIRAVVPLDTQAYDFSAVANDGILPGIYRTVFGNDPEFWAFASPLTYVAPGKGIPPMVVAYSGGAEGGAGSSRPEAAERFVTALQAAGVTAVLVPAPEKGHAQINQEFGLPGDHVTDSVMDFLAGVWSP